VSDPALSYNLRNLVGVIARQNELIGKQTDAIERVAKVLERLANAQLGPPPATDQEVPTRP